MDITVTGPQESPGRWLAGVLAQGLPDGPWTVHDSPSDTGTGWLVATPDLKTGWNFLGTDWGVRRGRLAAFVVPQGPSELIVRSRLASVAPLVAVLERHAGEWDGRVTVEDQAGL